MFFVSALKSILQLLHSNNSPRQISLAIALGFILGISPKGTLGALVIFLILFFFKVNFSAAVLSATFFSLIAGLFDIIGGPIGYALLSADFLYSFWRAVYNLPVIPWTKFYNTIVLGNFLVGLILFYPLLRLVELLVGIYRQEFARRLEKTRLLKIIKMISLYNLYEKFGG